MKWNAGNLSTEDLHKIMGVKERGYKLVYGPVGASVGGAAGKMLGGAVATS